MTTVSSTTSSGGDSESPEDVQLARTEMKLSWGVGVFTSYSHMHAGTHLMASQIDRSTTDGSAW